MHKQQCDMCTWTYIEKANVYAKRGRSANAK